MRPFPENFELYNFEKKRKEDQGKALGVGKTGDKGERKNNVRGRREEPEGARKEAKGGGQTKE